MDATDLDHIPCQSFEVCYNLPIPLGDMTPWKTQKYTVYFRGPRLRLILGSQLANPDFKDEMDSAPKQVVAADGSREYEKISCPETGLRSKLLFPADGLCLMRILQTEIARDSMTHGAVYVPAFLGSDKTTVSVATGQNDYYLLYLPNGLVHNNVRRAHRNAVSLIGFLACSSLFQKVCNAPCYLPSLILRS
ncbi:hypothetical protein GGX14DRAFT_696479 [Mycena pura]|uniref:Uncharacterized protein n=1 Tax=Mycena pura TaxID=153505 RepID=A0AAD6VNX9_9AGAR|nr:hypothetical protein GGX14DRAFT_696479 [Mycena pura]